MIKRIFGPPEDPGKSDPIDLRNGRHWYPIEGLDMEEGGSFRVSFGGETDEDIQDIGINKIDVDWSDKRIYIEGIGLDDACAWVVKDD